MFKLTIEDDEGKTTVIPVIRDEMSIGRQEGNTIRLTERNVSRKHARILRQNGSIFIEDLASFTGVKVNGAKIAVLTPVHEGDEVQIGDYKLMVRADRPAVAVDGDRATMPSMPATLGPMATVGGSVAIPTRGTAAAMAAQQAAAAAAAAAPAVNGGAPSPGRPAGSPIAVAELPGAPDPIEAQPTIPVRTLGEAAFAGPEAEAAPPARLMVLTTELAGMEYVLNRASLVIGRTDENEVVLNHRSISRHHAKVVREGNRYTIVDLQSANGVRVNGEDYERIELHPGDVIELGHVKLRFVGPFEHYVFDPGARYDSARFPTRIAVSVAGVAVLAVIAIAALRGGRPRSAEAEGTVAMAPAQATAPIAAAPAAAPAIAAAPGPAAPEAPSAGAPPTTPMTPEALLAEATRAAGVEDWDAARAALDRLGTQDAGPGLHRRAVDLRRKVDTERLAVAAFARFDEAQAAKAYADAIARYADIPADSIYKRRARGRFEERRSVLVAEHLTAAERARTAGRCQDVKQETDEIERLDPQNQLAKEMLRLCHPRADQPVAVAARPARAKPAAMLAAQTSSRPERPERAERVERTDRAEPAPRRAEAAPAEPGADADDLMKQAREAWLRQQCGSAIDLSRKALRARPGMTDAFQIIAVCSCSLKDADGAARAYGKLDDKSRNLVRSLCQRNGIVVGQE